MSSKTRKRQNRSQRRRKNSSAYTIRGGGFLTLFRNFRQRRAAAATVRARESQARRDRNESPRFRTSPGRWIRTRFRRNPSNAANPPPPPPPLAPAPAPAFEFDESMNEHDAPDPRILDHYFDIYREESNATDEEKDQARRDLNHYLSRVTRNIEREGRSEMKRASAIARQSNANIDNLHAIFRNVSRPDSSNTPSTFRRRSRPGSGLNILPLPSIERRIMQPTLPNTNNK
jgi:hypothetical protein